MQQTYMKIVLVQLLYIFNSNVVGDRLSEGECHCKTKLALDVAVSHQWPSVNFISLKQDEECLPTFSSVLKLFGASKTFSILNIRKEDSQNDSLSFLQKKRFLFFIAYYSEDLTWLLQELNRYERFFSRSSWVIFIKDESEFSELKNLTKTLNVLIDSNFFIFDVSECQINVQPYSAYRVGERVTDLIVEKGGTWNIITGFSPPFLNASLHVRRWDFQGYPMKAVGVNIFPHFTTYLKNGDVSGFVGDLVWLLKMAHNFTITYSILEGYAYGTLINNDLKANKWNGMVGVLQRKEADLTLSEVSITMERALGMTYTQPIYIISRKIYAATREDTRRKLLTYTRQMSPLLFFLVFLMMMILMFFMILISRIEWKFAPSSMENGVISIGTAVWYMFSALVQQGCTSEPETISTRMVFIYGFVFAFVIFTSYSANLVADLAVTLPVALPFGDLLGLSQQIDWDAGNVKNDLFEVVASQICRGNPSEECQLMQTLWNKIILKTEGNIVPTYPVGLQRVLEMKYVFIGVDVTTRQFIKALPSEKACTIKELPPKYITGGIAIGLQYKSPFFPLFGHSLQTIKEMGIMSKLAKKWFTADMSCESDSLLAADIIDVASLFTLLIIGIGIALLVLAVEYIVYRYSKSKKKRRSSVIGFR